VDALQRLQAAERLPNLFSGIVSRNFTAQIALAQYGQEQLEKLSTLQQQPQSYQHSLYALADLYCQGYELQWSTLYGANPPARVNLPTYPFAKERYWVPATEAMSSRTRAVLTVDSSALRELIDGVKSGALNPQAAAEQVRQALHPSTARRSRRQSSSWRRSR
jgi:acyl transferase domain-containing protein